MFKENSFSNSSTCTLVNDVRVRFESNVGERIVIWDLYSWKTTKDVAGDGEDFFANKYSIENGLLLLGMMKKWYDHNRIDSWIVK